MDPVLLLRFAHLVGLMLMSAGLIGVFVADMRSRQVRDVALFAQAVTFIAVFYDGLVVPALLLLGSGTRLIVSYGGWEFLNVPWLAGMVLLFALEFIEGNTITRLYFMRLRRLARAAVADRRVTRLARARRAACIVHALPRYPDPVGDRVSRCTAPERWTQFVIGMAIAILAASLLNYLVPRLYPWSGDETRPSHGVE